MAVHNIEDKIDLRVGNMHAVHIVTYDKRWLDEVQRSLKVTTQHFHCSAVRCSPKSAPHYHQWASHTTTDVNNRNSTQIEVN